MKPNTLKILRKDIDKIDKELIRLLGKRFKITYKVGVYKRNM